jgi:hypothetical protein
MPPSKGRRIPDVSLLIAARGVECLNGMVRHRTVPELVTELKIWVPNLMTAAKVAPMGSPVISASSSDGVVSDLHPQKYRACSRLEILGRASCNHDCEDWFHGATLANG